MKNQNWWAKSWWMVLAFIVLSGCTVVGPGERGVRITLGSVSDEPKTPGPYLWIPFLMGMARVDVQVQKSEIASTGATKDMQDVHAKVAINWSLSPENVVKTFREIGDERDVEHRILEPAVNEVMKASTAKRTAEEVLTQRMDMKKDIDDGLALRLKNYGITLHDVSVVDLGFSADFTAAIERKQIAEQSAKQAEYVAKQATQEAAANVERAKGQAEAQRLMKTTITEELLQKLAIEKWDGKFPTYMAGNGGLPFITTKGD